MVAHICGMKKSPMAIILGVLAMACAAVAVWQYFQPHQFWYYQVVTHDKAPAEALEQSLRTYAAGQPIEIERLGEHSVGYRVYGESPTAAGQRSFVAYRFTHAEMQRQGF